MQSGVTRSYCYHTSNSTGTGERPPVFYAVTYGLNISWTKSTFRLELVSLTSPLKILLKLSEYYLQNKI